MSSTSLASRPRLLREVEALARVHTVEALDVIVQIMRDPDAGKQVRLNAATEVLNRGWGKARQIVRSEDGMGRLSDRELDREINRRVEAITGLRILEHEDDGAEA